MLTTASLLPDGAVAAYRDQGFLHLKGVFDAARMAEIRAWTDSLSQAPEVSGREWKYFEKSALDGSRLLSRIENFTPYHDGFRKLLTEGPLPEAVGALIGDEAVLFKEKINFKLRGGAGFEAHQDVQAGWSDYAPRHISVLIAIDAMTPENGCLEVLPGTHKDGLLGQMWAPLTDAQTSHKPYTKVPCAAGDVLFFDSYLPHRSAPNTTTATRRGAYVTYNGARDGDSRARYHAEKYANYPPDVDRDPDGDYGYKV